MPNSPYTAVVLDQDVTGVKVLCPTTQADASGNPITVQTTVTLRRGSINKLISPEEIAARKAMMAAAKPTTQPSH